MQNIISIARYGICLFFHFALLLFLKLKKHLSGGSKGVNLFNYLICFFKLNQQQKETHNFVRCLNYYCY